MGRMEVGFFLEGRARAEVAQRPFPREGREGGIGNSRRTFTKRRGVGEYYGWKGIFTRAPLLMLISVERGKRSLGIAESPKKTSLNKGGTREVSALKGCPGVTVSMRLAKRGSGHLLISRRCG